MKRVLGVAALAAVSGVSGKSTAGSADASSPLITASGTYDFLSSSVLLTKDLVFFCGSTATELVLQQLPPKVQGQVADKWEEGMDKVNDAINKANTIRLQNGIPPVSEIVAKVQSRVKSVVTLVEASPPFALTRTFLAAFERAYPQHKGLLSGAGLLDLVVVALFLSYFVFSYMLAAFCYVFCCGCCAKRKNKKAAPVELRKASDKKRR